MGHLPRQPSALHWNPPGRLSPATCISPGNLSPTPQAPSPGPAPVFPGACSNSPGARALLVGGPWDLRTLCLWRPPKSRRHSDSRSPRCPGGLSEYTEEAPIVRGGASWVGKFARREFLRRPLGGHPPSSGKVRTRYLGSTWLRPASRGLAYLRRAGLQLASPRSRCCALSRCSFCSEPWASPVSAASWGPALAARVVSLGLVSRFRLLWKRGRAF